MQERYDDVKYKRIAEELITKLAYQKEPHEVCFYNRQELGQHYGIAPMTAYKVMKYLENLGLIHCRPGQRALIRWENLKKISRTRKSCQIAVCTYEDRKSVPSACCTLLQNHLSNRLQEEGHTVRHLSLDDPGEDPLLLLKGMDGVMLANGIDPKQPLYRKLTEAGIPFSGYTFNGIGANLACIMEDYYLLQICLYLMRSGCKTILSFGLECVPFRTRRRMRNVEVIRQQLKNYDYDANVEFISVQELDFNLLAESLHRAIPQGLDQTKFGIICQNFYLSEMLFELLNDAGLKPPDDYQLISEEFPPAMRQRYSYIDFKLNKLADVMFNLLYLQLNTGTTRSFSELILPELIEL